MARDFIVPGHIVTGANALEDATSLIVSYGKKALLVSDPVMEKIGNVKKVTDLLENNAIEYAVYTDIVGEPTDTMIEKGVQLYRESNCDFFIAIGGGSPIDSMKAIAAVIGNGGEINDYLGKVIEGKTPPMVAIPTTAGTGSEATQFTIITNTKEDIKMLLKGAVLMPFLAIMTLSLHLAHLQLLPQLLDWMHFVMRLSLILQEKHSPFLSLLVFLR